MAWQTNQRKTTATKLLAVTLLLVLVCATGKNIFAHLSVQSGEQGAFFVITAFEDKALVKKKGRDTVVEAFVGMQLTSGDQLQTGPFGTAELKGSQGETITVECNTSLEIGDGMAIPGRGYNVSLTIGRIWVKVIKLTRALENVFRFSIITPTAFAGVRGTTFSVTVDDDLVTEVSVFDGTVEVIATHARVKVTAGHSTKVRPGRKPEVPSEHSEEQNREWEKRRHWFDEKPGKLPPPFQEDWQPPGLVGKDKQPGNSGQGQGNVPSQNKHIPKGKGKSGTHPGKGQDWSSPDKKLPPKTQGPKGSEKNE